MIKWFCDVCKLEIVAPEHPVRVYMSRCGKNRDDADVGWGHDDEIARLFCHKTCADGLQAEIKEAITRSRAKALQEP